MWTQGSSPDWRGRIITFDLLGHFYCSFGCHCISVWQGSIAGSGSRCCALEPTSSTAKLLSRYLWELHGYRKLADFIIYIYMYIYVCVYVYMYVYTHKNIYTQTQLHVYLYSYIYIITQIFQKTYSIQIYQTSFSDRLLVILSWLPNSYCVLKIASPLKNKA